MTRQKSFKRQIRSRMEKTSESYTAARRVLIAKAATHTAPEPAGQEFSGSAAAEAHAPAAEHPPAPSPTGVSAGLPANVLEKTGRDWQEWFSLVDGWGGASRPHREIARWLMEEHGVAGWWSQSITVAYERARGLRQAGQKRDGTYSVSASKTVNVPVEALYRAFVDPAIRNRWLPGAALEVTTAAESKSVRGRWTEDGSRMVAGFEAKSDAKSLVGVAHEKLPDAGAAKSAKEFWVKRLGELKKLLES